MLPKQLWLEHQAETEQEARQVQQKCAASIETAAANAKPEAL